MTINYIKFVSILQMQQNIINDQYGNQHLEQYKIMNESLAKKVKSRQKKIKFLYSCLQEYEKIYSSQQNLINQINLKLTKERIGSNNVENSIQMKSIGKKQKLKSSKLWDFKQKKYNLFQKETINFMNLQPLNYYEQEQKNVRLPQLKKSLKYINENPERRSHEKYSVLTEPKRQKFFDNLQSQIKSKIYKLPMQKLIPISQEQIKKRMQRKLYQGK